MRKKIKVGVYTIYIEYDMETDELSVSIYDELDELIDKMTISNDEDANDEDEEGDDNFNINWN